MTTRLEYNNMPPRTEWIGIDFTQRRIVPFMDAFLREQGIDDPSLEASSARLAWSLVEARFRLADISRSVTTGNENRIAAQAADVAGFDTKRTRFIDAHPYGKVFLAKFEPIFVQMATEARVPDTEEREHMRLGQLGRISEIIVSCEPREPYAHEDPSTRTETGFFK